MITRKWAISVKVTSLIECCQPGWSFTCQVRSQPPVTSDPWAWETLPFCAWSHWSVTECFSKSWPACPQSCSSLLLGVTSKSCISSTQPSFWLLFSARSPLDCKLSHKQFVVLIHRVFLRLSTNNSPPSFHLIVFFGCVVSTVPIFWLIFHQEDSTCLTPNTLENTIGS